MGFVVLRFVALREASERGEMVVGSRGLEPVQAERAEIPGDEPELVRAGPGGLVQRPAPALEAFRDGHMESSVEISGGFL